MEGLERLFVAISFIIVAFYSCCNLTMVTAQEELVVCRASANCSGAPDDELGVMTIEECCLNTPNGLGFSEEEVCSPCIVFGFFNESFVGSEQEQGHTVKAGYQKGATLAQTNMYFYVIDIPGTASMGAGFDYTVSTTVVRFLFSRPNPPEEVLFIFRMDAIAQEENETLILGLVPGITLSGRNVFFKSIINLTIIDSDEVEIFFTEDDYRTNERNISNPDEPAFAPVVVTKSSRIANPIVLDVIPLTVEMARVVLSSSDLPENIIPMLNPFSPPYADLNDFDNITIRITFDPDEFANDDERAAPIRIFNDPINEANEQVFVVQLFLISSTNPGLVVLDTRPTSLCRIVDDDIIRIGFEEPRYTYIEPDADEDIDLMFVPRTNLTVNGPIYLAKQDNVQSEQTFRINIQVADSVPSGENINPTTLGADYSLGNNTSASTVAFTPNVQRVLLPITLFHDDFSEGTEAFRASSSAEDTAEIHDITFDLPVYLPPIALFAETFVVIEDDDYRVIIGFEETNYTVNESVGKLEVYVSVISHPPGVDLIAAIVLGIQSVASTASGGADYKEIDLAKLDVSLLFDENSHRQSFRVTINNDELLETTEDFDLELRFDPFYPQPSGVILSPNVFTVYIEDDDAATIGFSNTTYSIHQTNGQLNISVEVISGSLQREVVINLTVFDTSYHANRTIDILTIIFNCNVTIFTLEMTESILELSKSAMVTLSFPGIPLPGVMLSPASALINIDAVVIGFTNTSYFVHEDNGDVTLIAHIRGGMAQCNTSEWTVYFNITAKSAQSSEDYKYFSNEFILTNTSQQAVAVISIVNDSLLEINETFRAEISLVLMEDRNCVLLLPSAADVTILDYDTAIVGFVEDNYFFTEGDGLVNLTLEVAPDSGQLGREVKISLHVHSVSAINGSDFILTESHLTLNQSVRSVPVPIKILNDELFESSIETLFVTLSSDVSHLQTGSAEAVVTIADDDLLTIGFNSTGYSINENGDSVLLSVHVLEEMISEDVIIHVRLTTFHDTANATVDYENLTIILNFNESSTKLEVPLSIIDDNVLENNEEFTVLLELLDAKYEGRVMLQPNVSRITILDDDTAVIGFVNQSYTTTEGEEFYFTIGVLSSTQLERVLVVVLETQSDTAEGGQDFDVIKEYQLTFGPSVTLDNVSINITADEHFEKDEHLNVILSAKILNLDLNTESIRLKHSVCQEGGRKLFSVSNETIEADKVAAIDLDRVHLTQTRDGLQLTLASKESDRIIVSPAVARMTIMDNNTITIGFSSKNYSVNECDGQVSITIEVVGSLQREVVVYLSTSNQTAYANVDYEGLNQPLTFDSINKAITVNVSIVINTSETSHEMDKGFTVSIAFLREEIPRVLLEPDNANVSIFEADGIVGFIVPEVIERRVSESVGVVNITVGLISAKLCGQMEVSFSIDNTSNATDEQDFSLMTESPLILSTEYPNNTISICILEDKKSERLEVFNISLYFKGVSPPRVTLNPSTATVVIVDNDVLHKDNSTVAVSDPSDSVLIGGIVGSMTILLVIMTVVTITCIIIFCFMKQAKRKNPRDEFNDEEIEESFSDFCVETSYKLILPPHLIIHHSNICMTETVGQGEFGIVYKGHLVKDQGQVVTEVVAIKTLKGFYSRLAVRDMLKECSKMIKFDHPNVLKLIGVCLDGSPAPFIIMPFMANGSLLTYLKKNRQELVFSQDSKDNVNIGAVCKRLMDMCRQVAVGMDYLVQMKVVHRDLAARNCMIDLNYVIKVADFGLAESVGTKEYFRQDKFAPLRLPIKWLAPECLEDHIFSEKSDVWAYGVTCWEIFSGGKVPFATINLAKLPRMILDGYRLEKPLNKACSGEIYKLMLQCWDSQPENRPTFSNIVGSLSQSLVAIAGYLEIVGLEETSKQPEDLESKEKDQSQYEEEESQEVVVGTTFEETPL